jgi:hypothetical protein
MPFKRASAAIGFTWAFVKTVTSKRVGKNKHWVNFDSINTLVLAL